MSDPQFLINAYLDHTLSDDELSALEAWLSESPQHRQTFIEVVMLHDRLRGECLAMSAMSSLISRAANPISRSRRIGSSVAALVVAATAMTLVIVLFWNGLGGGSASAAVLELNRLIAANSQATDRTYRISVEESARPGETRDFHKPTEVGRPPKPPLDEAVLHVGHGDRFVLVRKTKDGQPFITGSDGRTSWAVRPDGPVRVSRDLSRFNRDLPGHEQGVPLFQIEHGLEQLRTAYDVQILPPESDETRSDSPPERLLVAIKRKGYRGAQRVEIAYVPATGLINEMRFVKMPYGPERLTIRLTLIDDSDLAPDFFHHASHHSSDRIVKEE